MISSFGCYGVNPQEFPLFQNMDEESICDFFSLGHQMDFPAGSPLISHLDPGETFFLTLHGLAKLVLVHPHNEPLHLTVFRMGDFFGETSILEPGTPRSANVYAVTDVSMFAIHKKEFMYLVRTYPELMINIARSMGQRLTIMNERIMTERLKDQTRKVAHTLAFFADKGRFFKEAGTILLPSLPLQEWALFCYTMREELIDSMERLKQAGAIQWQNQRIAIINLDVLRRFAEVHLVP
jgi:CRP-like cAMP-binding protein